MPNASLIEWAWTLVFVAALIGSVLYARKGLIRELQRRRDDGNGLLVLFARWQGVVTGYFILTELLGLLLGIVAMLAPPPIRASTAQAANVTAWGFIGWALLTMGVTWFVWYSDGRLAREVGKGEAAAEAIAIVEANTEAVLENTAAVEANTEQKG